MPTGPRGEQRPADVVGCAVKVMQVATGEETEDLHHAPEPEITEAKRAAGRRGGAARARSLPSDERTRIASDAASARWRQDDDQEVPMASRILDPVNNEADRAVLQAEFARHQADTEYRDAHREEWLTQYPDQWVMVYNGALVVVASTIDEAFELVEKQGIPRGKPVRAYLTAKPQTMILGTTACR